jgi:hypothetical protein
MLAEYDVAAAARMTPKQFVAAFAELGIAEFDILTARLFELCGHNDEALAGKLRAMSDHRVKVLRAEQPDWFFD